MMRSAQLARKTAETDIALSLDLDGTGKTDIQTGVGFFDHMLTLLGKHAMMDLTVRCAGDLQVDSHHSVEDVGIALGQAFAKALGDKRGITRYGSAYLPMDETLALVALDLSGRPYLVFDAAFDTPLLGNFETEMTEEFFRAFAMNGGVTLHAKVLYGANTHHKIEALFKGLGRALRMACAPDARETGVPSTKGVLE
ncbi:MAG: imidazoleglycerol-phosphate dehydratase HisB [Eubacteriales bacterium]|nr:imidazoleglycerol-phosphate dehydratase HisB [Eubacteriales bacterium]